MFLVGNLTLVSVYTRNPSQLHDVLWTCQPYVISFIFSPP